MLLGADITISTDHRNLTFDTFSTQQVMRWRLYVEEYAPKLLYIEGKLNVLADAFSRLPRFEDGGFVESNKPPGSPSNESMYVLDEAFRNNCFGVDEELIHDNNFMYDDCLCNIDDRKLMECLQWHSDVDAQMSYVNLPMTEENPLSTKGLKAAQDSNLALQQKLFAEPDLYHRRKVGGAELICYQPPNENWKICLTNTNVDASIEFMHKLLCYPGQNQLRRGMRVYYHPQLTRKVREYKDDVSQRVKSAKRGFGHLAP